jgi:hypothetical protein
MRHLLPHQFFFALRLSEGVKVHAVIRSNAGLEAALAIGILAHRILVGGVATKARRRRDGFIGLPETFRACRLRIRRLRRDSGPKNWNEQSKSEQRFFIQHVGFLLV